MTSSSLAIQRLTGLAMAVCAITLGGCVSHYKPVANVPTATLVIESDRPTFVQAFKSEACDKADGGSRISFLHPYAGDPLRGTAKPIEAGKPLLFSVDMNTPVDGEMASCNITASFLPEAGRTYHLFFHFGEDDKRCTLAVMRRSEQGAIEAEPSFRKLPVHCHNSVDG